MAKERGKMSMNQPRKSLILALILPFLAFALALPIAFAAPVAFATSIGPGPCGGDPTACIYVGRMTGGGFVFDTTGNKITFGFEIHCSSDSHPNNIEVNWNGNRFHLEDYSQSVCWNDPAISPNPPKAGFNTIEATGFGRLNGVSGAFISVTFKDAGEPGAGHDLAQLVIKNPDNTVAISVGSPLAGGNIQAHK
jgi:hypothetical protein